MFSLSYSRAYDPYHALFRFVALLRQAEENSLEFRRLRVADFYVCFPWLLSDFRVPRRFLTDRNSLIRRHRQSRYEVLPSSRYLFERMEIFHRAALSAMLGNRLVAETENPTVHEGLQLIEDAIPPGTRRRIEEFTVRNGDLLRFLAKAVDDIPFEGRDGLKDRSGLIEFRYDNV